MVPINDPMVNPSDNTFAHTGPPVIYILKAKAPPISIHAIRRARIFTRLRSSFIPLTTCPKSIEYGVLLENSIPLFGAKRVFHRTNVRGIPSTDTARYSSREENRVGSSNVADNFFPLPLALFSFSCSYRAILALSP